METNYAIKPIAEKLLQSRRSQRITQLEVAKKLLVPQSYISRIEQGRTDIRTTKLIELARILGLEVMLVPKKCVPVVESIIAERSGSLNRPLYEAPSENDDE